MIERERAFLAKELPSDLHNHPSKELLDIYLPKTHPHPLLRLRKRGDVCEMTKKELIGGDQTKRRETTIPLTKEEFDALSMVDGKRVHKIRYNYPWEGRTLEIDVFQGALKGLVLIDVEFESEEDMASFTNPPFVLAEITSHEDREHLAGGMLCGRSYEDVKERIEKYGYRKL